MATETETTTTTTAPVTDTTAATTEAAVAATEEDSPKGLAARWAPDWKEKLAAKTKIPIKTEVGKADADVGSGAGTGEAVATTTTEAKPEDELSARLAEIARKNRVVAKREAALKDKEAQLLQSTKADTELASRLRAATSSGKRVEILKAAGITEEELLRGTWVIDLLEELQQADEGGPPVSEARARQLMEQRAQNEEKIRREQLQAQEAKRNQELLKGEEAAQATYFQGVGKLVKAGNFPLVSAVRPTYGDLDAEYRKELVKTGVRLKPEELLARFEERYKKAGIAVAQQQSTSARTASSVSRSPRTVTSEMVNDAGGRSVLLSEEKKKSYYELTQDAKAAVKRRYGNTWNTRGVRTP
jgi:hypothetical protein